MQDFHLFRMLPRRWVRQAGLTLVEVIASLGVMSVAMIGVTQLSKQFSDDARNALVADQMKRIGHGAQAYVKDNYTTLMGAATGSMQVITVSDLVLGGHVTAGTVSSNAMGQSLCILVRKPTAAKLEALVVTEGGEAISDLDLGAIASMAGGSAGSISAEIRPTEIVGTMGTWAIPVATYHDIANTASKKCDGTSGRVQVAAGHLAMALWLEDSVTQASTLYRDEVSGSPQLNTMNTPIIMNAQKTPYSVCADAISGAVANAADGSVLSCNGASGSKTWKPSSGVYWMESVERFVNLPACSIDSAGMTRVVKTPSTPAVQTAGTRARAYTCIGSSVDTNNDGVADTLVYAWDPLASDDTGVLTLDGGLRIKKQVPVQYAKTWDSASSAYTNTDIVDGAGNPLSATDQGSCTTAEVGTVAMSADGSLLMCQN